MSNCVLLVWTKQEKSDHMKYNQVIEKSLYISENSKLLFFLFDKRILFIKLQQKT